MKAYPLLVGDAIIQQMKEERKGEEKLSKASWQKIRNKHVICLEYRDKYDKIETETSEVLIDPQNKLYTKQTKRVRC